MAENKVRHLPANAALAQARYVRTAPMKCRRVVDMVRGLDVQEALDVPRSFGHDGVLDLEQGISAGIEAELQKRGHKTTRPIVPLGSGQIIWRDSKTGSLIAGSDCRKDGSAAGF